MEGSAGLITQRSRVINEIRQFNKFFFTSVQLAFRTQYTTKQTGRVCSYLKSKGFVKVVGQMKIDGQSSIHNVYQTTDKFSELIEVGPLRVLTNSIIDFNELRKKRCESCPGCPHHDKKFPNKDSNVNTTLVSITSLTEQMSHLTKIFRGIVNLLVSETSPEEITKMRTIMKSFDQIKI